MMGSSSNVMSPAPLLTSRSVLSCSVLCCAGRALQTAYTVARTMFETAGLPAHLAEHVKVGSLQTRVSWSITAFASAIANSTRSMLCCAVHVHAVLRQSGMWCCCYLHHWHMS
jgi:hypothetical protein